LDLAGAGAGGERRHASHRRPVGFAAPPAGPAEPPTAGLPARVPLSQAAWSRGKRRKGSIAMKPRDSDGGRKRERRKWNGKGRQRDKVLSVMEFGLGP